MEEKMDSFSQTVGEPSDFDPGIGLDPRDPDLRDGRWCYDTPGTVQPDQVKYQIYLNKNYYSDDSCSQTK
jgi:hypothetical protein